MANSNYDPRREEEILKFWEENKIFEKSLEKTKNGKPFVFYDGPPFATGLPHFGHVLPTTIKDIIPRYQTMQGRYVPRVWGWDCHGLPIENLVEKKLGLKNKKDIEEYGVEKFNKEARESVLSFADEWKKIIPRLGRWIDMDNDYRTMNPNFTESVWWSFKEMNKKGLVYEGFKSMHWCPHCGTVLSNFEVGQGYKDITDISVYVIMGEFLVWTTTPWTLPGNVALAVNPEIKYVKVKTVGRNLIVAKDRLEALSKILGDYEILEEIGGRDLVGLSYIPPFNYYKNNKGIENHERGWKVYYGDFVTTTEGTGVVHIAPAFGEDDLNLGYKEKLPFVQHVDQEGKFKQEVKDFAGLYVKPRPKSGGEKSQDHQVTDIEIIKHLAGKDILFAKEKIIHSYPHCWRCDTPLLNYATSSWFIKVTDFKDQLVKENEKVNWNPEHVGKGRFGNWLENARDWSISRSRYWGAPLPIWKSDPSTEPKAGCKEIEFIGSIDELKSKIKRNNYFVLRHGQSEHNVKNLMSSLESENYHVTEKGVEEVMNSAKTLQKKNIDVIITSPLIRTRETAEIVAREIGFKEEILVDQRISEEQFGDLEGKTHQEFNEYFAKVAGTPDRASLRMPNGETLLDIRERVGEFLYEIDSKYEGKNILLISHSGIIRMMEAICQGGLRELFLRWEHFPLRITGSLFELEFVSLPHNEMYELDLHRPYIDEITWKSEKGNKMVRIKDVFDTWYDSGSMPFASKHYPFDFAQGRPFEDTLFPANFIAEGVDQTRGWFYSLLVLNVGLFDKSPYQNVIVNGTILAEDGRKMAKSLNNYPPLLPTVEKYGADALRYFFASSPAVKAEDMNFSEKGLEEVIKKHFNRLYNVLSLYEMLTPDLSSLRMRGSSEISKNSLDLWIVSLLHKTRNDMTKYLESYELDKATKPIGDFIEDLSVWYTRRSRERLKNKDEGALSTTHYVLREFSKLMAPFVPFIAEDIYQRLNTTSSLSVHLEAWPEEQKVDESLLKQMQEVRRVVTLGLELRNKAGIKVRQPLSRLMLREDVADIGEEEELLGLIKDELNLKEVVFDADIEEEAKIDIEITEDLRKEGVAREIIRTIQDLRKEKGLQPGEEIEVSVRSPADIHHIISEYEEMISKVTSVINFIFEESGEDKLEIRIS